jgi:hypothetical protein
MIVRVSDQPFQLFFLIPADFFLGPGCLNQALYKRQQLQVRDIQVKNP